VLTDVAGIRVGHWTDARARTGCTAVLLPDGTVGSAEIWGGAPATRELEVLAPHRTVQQVDAVLLTGGSAFGLAAADGVMRWCEEHGRGVPTPGGIVPIVPALGLFDLAVGDPAVRPGPEQGFAACEDAREDGVAVGPVGAGTGATLGAWSGNRRAGGIGAATERAGDLVVSALLAVNAFGDLDPFGRGAGEAAAKLAAGHVPGADLLTNTTIGVVATNARLDKVGCLIVAQGGHGGLARALAPAHTRFDGDGIVAVATGAVDAHVDAVRMLAVSAVERAVRSIATADPPAG
jgi:L-aminopeptidase/D-esterase-like protein